jgi:ankyrin repeat protein
MTEDGIAAFVEAACVPLDSGHASGTLERAETILVTQPDIASGNIYVAAVLGDADAVQRFVETDRAQATRKGGPRDWDPLTYLCFSRYLRLDHARRDGFVRAARTLLDAGADANTGFYSNDHLPLEFESVLYGAAGIAHDAALTRLLLEHGADPNDGEVVYHAPETYDNAALHALVETGKLTADSLASMLLRKCDWHDYDGVRWLLEHGADPNFKTRWGYSALHQAIRRDNQIETIELMLDHGADPMVVGHGLTAVEMSARDGRGDVLDLFERRGIPLRLQGIYELLAACARNDAARVRSIAQREPGFAGQVVMQASRLLREFAGIGNTEGVRHLLDLGVDVAAVDHDGDGYWGIAKNSTALHVAAWLGRHATVKLLIERGAPLDVADGNGATPLALAVGACVHPYWGWRRAPASVAALLDAGASTQNVPFPSGYDEVDELLRSRSA